MDVLVASSADGVVVEVHGAVDVFTVSRLREVLLPLVLAGEHDVVVDCSSLTRIDATGLGVLVAALRISRRTGVQFALGSPSPALRALLRETRLDRWLPTVELPDVVAAG